MCVDMCTVCVHVCGGGVNVKLVFFLNGFHLSTHVTHNTVQLGYINGIFNTIPRDVLKYSLNYIGCMVV